MAKTINIDNEVHTKAKLAACERGVTLQSFVEVAVLAALYKLDTIYNSSEPTKPAKKKGGKTL